MGKSFIKCKIVLVLIVVKYYDGMNWVDVIKSNYVIYVDVFIYIDLDNLEKYLFC